MKSNYVTFADKIRAAKSIDACDRLDKSLTNLYDNGVFTVNQFSRLDDLIFKRRFALGQWG